MALLQVKNLTVGFTLDDGRSFDAVRDVSFVLNKESTLGIVGESGCGKSVTALSLMRLLPKPASHIRSGEIRYKDQDLLTLPVEDLCKLRGRNIAMIFQEPMTALNPVINIGRQISEVFSLHFPNLTHKDIERECIEILSMVGIPEPQTRLKQFPHQLSGGMRQRVMIALAVACKPEILIADEPTTALDVTIQAQILSELKSYTEKNHMSMILITHDLGVVAENCDKVLVMYAGEIVESGDVISIFENPKHPYTQGLLDCIPKLTTKPKAQLNTIPGHVPAATAKLVGCRFVNRCSKAMSICNSQIPTLSEGPHAVRCHLYGRESNAI